MKLLFTKGILGLIKNNKIILISDSSLSNTNYSYNIYGIKKIEKEFKIKFIGEINSERYITEEKDFKFIINQNGVFKNFENEMYKLDSEIVELYDLVEKRIFKDKEYYDMINLSPIFIATEGIEQNFYMSKKEFEHALKTSVLLEYLDTEVKYKLIYVYDLQSLINDIKHSFFSIINPYIHASNELCYSNDALSQYIKDKDENIFEYTYDGPHANILCSHFMNSIIKICSTLDILTKFMCEITNMPSKYNKYIKFKCGGIYFSNIGRFEEIFKELDNYKGSIIDKRKSFDEIINIRHTIIHNSFLSNKPKILAGCGTPEINNNKLIYKKIYIWDTNEDGRAERWVNRSKFYSQSRCIQEYLLSEIINLFDSFNKTILLFKEYLEL